MTLIDKSPIYNTIGKTYDTTRKADPNIARKIVELLNPQKDKKYLDIGCGSGNYTGALSIAGLNMDGVDVSADMLKKAKAKYPNINWYEANVTNLLFPADSYDGATCVLVTHHIKDLSAAFKEIFRVISQGKFVIFTATPEQRKQYWLREYFPTMIEDSCKIQTSVSAFHSLLSAAGFKNIYAEPYFVTKDLQDLFLYAGKYRPQIYLDPFVREGISFFHLYDYKHELDKGLSKLQKDINTGKIQEIIKNHENTLGDYSFVVGEK